VSALLLAPLLARHQVRAFEWFEPPTQVILHAGRTTPVAIDLGLRHTARHVLVDVTRADATPLERERAPRLALAVVSTVPSTVPSAGSSAGSSAGRLVAIRVDVATRVAARGRSSALAATFESVFPFGLFRAEARLVASTEVVVLPRVLRRGGAALERWLSEVTAGDESSAARPLPRSSGLPAAFRPSRLDDTVRDIAWRASARHLRWISVDRTPPSHDRVTVVLVTSVRGASTTSAHRSSAAFEAAVNICATAIDHLTRAGHEVTLRLVDTDSDAAPEQIARATSRVVSKSVRALPHLLVLTDVVARNQSSAPEGPAPLNASGRPRMSRGPQSLIVLACARPIADALGATPANTTLLLVDPNGRTSTSSPGLHRSAGNRLARRPLTATP
jgi:uncharacterized protein (DUF58 family)